MYIVAFEGNGMEVCFTCDKRKERMEMGLVKSRGGKGTYTVKSSSAFTAC